MMILYRIYQFVFMIPVLLVLTIITATVTIIGSIAGNGRWWGYWPAHIWAKAFCILTFVRVSVVGRENISRNTSYVFVSNHQGAYDIFAIYGYLRHNFRWMMKKALERIPLVGYSCRVAGHVYVDASSPAAIQETMHEARENLSHDMSVVVFPEGSRTPDGHMRRFKRGAFVLATQFNLPVVPMCIEGAYDVMPRNARLPRPGHIKLTIFPPILPDGANGNHADEMKLVERSYKTIADALPPRYAPQVRRD